MNNGLVNKYKLYGLVGALLLVTLIVVYLFFTHIHRLDKKAVYIDTFPSNAKITIDGNAVNRGKVYLKSGAYEIKASSKGFKDFSNTLWVNSSTDRYSILLESDSEEGKKWYTEHQSEYLRIRQQNERYIEEKGKYFHQLNPIASKLPYRTFMYTIGYRADQSDPTGNSIIIEIDAPEEYRQSAIYRIRQLGYDPTDFTINFRDYENPFPL